MADHLFRALETCEQDGRYRTSLVQRNVNELPEHDVLVDVHWSSLNYKDALSASGNKGVTRHYPHTPGIDAAGVVLLDRSGRLAPGTEVIITGYDLGMGTAGGYGERIAVPGQWVLPCPAGLALQDTMVLGTAGLTAGLCVRALLQAGLTPEQGDVLVTGASGGVGSIAVALLAQLGFRVVAMTGKTLAHDWLRSLGAAECLDRSELAAGQDKPMLAPRWAGAVDVVGGQVLAQVIKTTRYGGAVACCGLTGGAELPLTVFPFILRNVRLLGVDSVEQPLAEKAAIWDLFGGPWKLEALPAICSGIYSLDELPEQFDDILAGRIRGRVLVKVG